MFYKNKPTVPPPPSLDELHLSQVLNIDNTMLSTQNQNFSQLITQTGTTKMNKGDFTRPYSHLLPPSQSRKQTDGASRLKFAKESSFINQSHPGILTQKQTNFQGISEMTHSDHEDLMKPSQEPAGFLTQIQSDHLRSMGPGAKLSQKPTVMVNREKDAGGVPTMNDSPQIGVVFPHTQTMPAMDPAVLNHGSSQEDLFSSPVPSGLSDLHTDLSPTTLTLPFSTPGGTKRDDLKLKPVSAIPKKYRYIFNFPYFNIVQSRVFQDVLYTDQPLVVSAPTGSGKTVLFELAILRVLEKALTQKTGPFTFKVVYMAPVKALCSQRFDDWNNKFGPLGLKCMELTGDTDMDDYFELQEVNIILTTPEKWDSMTRKWRDNRSLVQLVRLFLIDEVHMLNDNVRGATMEAVVSRMKTLQSTLQRGKSTGMRLLAISATIPNAEDVAEWLNGACESAIYHKFDDSCRPVRLRKVVLGYPCSDTQSEFRFDLSLNYKLASIITTYSEQKPTLVFCATRKSVQQAASILLKDAKFVLNSQHKQRLQKQANLIKDSKLREGVLFGVGFHHAGLDFKDRKLIEELFSVGDLPVLMATSTLALGVNLPAHLVIIKSTQHYVMGVYQEYTESQVLQMIGRAGRPQFDTSATAVIMTRNSTKFKYDALLNGTQVIESSLHQHLMEHLNAEVVLNTITDVTVALEWIRSTFLYIRVMKNPKHYNIPEGLSKDQIEKRLQDLCLKNLNSLAAIELVKMDEDHFSMMATETGRVMSRYCVAYQTMKSFHGLVGTETMSELIDIVSKGQEFQDVKLRNNEKKTLNALNKDKNRVTIRFPVQGKVNNTEKKVSCLIQAQFGCLSVQDFALQQDTNKIFRTGIRIVRCLVEVMWTRNDFKALLNAVLLSKCFKSRLWENSRYVSRQLTGIGAMLSNALVNAGFCTFAKIEATNPREIELVVNRHPPFGNQVRDAVNRLPKYELSIDQLARYSYHTAELTITVTLANKDVLMEKTTAGPSHTCVLLIGDANNKVVHKCRISDALLLRTDQWSRKIEVKRADKGEELSVNLISQEWVGLDVQSTYTPFYTGGKKIATYSNTGPTYHQSGGVKKKESPKTTSSDYSISPEQEKQAEESSNIYDEFNTKPCAHRCQDKDLCHHECCKFGVPVSRRRHLPEGSSNQPTKQGKSVLEQYQRDLKHQLVKLPKTPNLKRLRTPQMKDFSLKEYAFAPTSGEKPKLQLDTHPAPKKTKPSTPDSPGLKKQTAAVVPTPKGWDDLDFFQFRQEAQANRTEEEYLKEGNICLIDPPGVSSLEKFRLNEREGDLPKQEGVTEYRMDNNLQKVNKAFTPSVYRSSPSSMYSTGTTGNNNSREIISDHFQDHIQQSCTGHMIPSSEGIYGDSYMNESQITKETNQSAHPVPVWRQKKLNFGKTVKETQPLTEAHSELQSFAQNSSVQGCNGISHHMDSLPDLRSARSEASVYGIDNMSEKSRSTNALNYGKVMHDLSHPRSMKSAQTPGYSTVLHESSLAGQLGSNLALPHLSSCKSKESSQSFMYQNQDLVWDEDADITGAQMIDEAGLCTLDSHQIKAIPEATLIQGPVTISDSEDDDALITRGATFDLQMSPEWSSGDDNLPAFQLPPNPEEMLTDIDEPRKETNSHSAKVDICHSKYSTTADKIASSRIGEEDTRGALVAFDSIFQGIF